MLVISLLLVGELARSSLSASDWPRPKFGLHFSALSSPSQEKYGLPYLLALYAATTVVYCLSVVIMLTKCLTRSRTPVGLQLAFSAVVFRGHLPLPFVAAASHLGTTGADVGSADSSHRAISLENALGSEDYERRRDRSGIRIIRRVPEDEVIAEFLKSDFENAAFEDYKGALRKLVMKPHLDDPGKTPNAAPCSSSGIDRCGKSFPLAPGGMK